MRNQLIKELQLRKAQLQKELECIDTLLFFQSHEILFPATKLKPLPSEEPEKPTIAIPKKEPVAFQRKMRGSANAKHGSREEAYNKIIERIDKGANVKAACKEEGVTDMTFYNWNKVYKKHGTKKIAAAPTKKKSPSPPTSGKIDFRKLSSAIEIESGDSIQIIQVFDDDNVEGLGPDDDTRFYNDAQNELRIK